MLVAALDTERIAALEAFKLINKLVFDHLPLDMATATCQQLVQMQAVTRMSHLLCPADILPDTMYIWFSGMYSRA